MPEKPDSIVTQLPAEHDPQFDPVPLTRYRGEKPETPDWFSAAVAVPYETHEVEVAGAKVRYQQWGDRAKPGLLFVHGNGAHAHWWDFIAPYFAADHNVAALTFCGMGDSETRDAYDMETFSAEQIGVMEHAGMFGHEIKPIICGHSFGGFVTMVTGAAHGDRLTGVVIVDSPINPPDRPRDGPPKRAARNRVYPTLEAALSRFRLAPPQPCNNHYAMDYIARHSLEEGIGDRGEAGWKWKFDPGIWRNFETSVDASQLLRDTACRIAIMRGEDSELMPDDVRKYMTGLLGHQVPFISIPHAYHHVMLDQPLAFIAALRTLLGEWEHSEPNREIFV